MNIRILGCHGSDQMRQERSGPNQCRTCGFLINGTVMLDAGTIGIALTLEEQTSIRHVLLSHLHFDHIKGLPTFGDNLVDDPAAPVVITSIPEVLNGLRTHIFNDRVYPDFLKLPSAERPVFIYRILEPGQPSEADGLQVTAIEVNHLVPAVGFVIREGASSILYSGDTYETNAIWDAARREPTLKAAFIETSFPDEMADVALASRHLTPSLLMRELGKLARPDVPVYIYHLKPRLQSVIERQLRNLPVENLTILQEGQEVVV